MNFRSLAFASLLAISAACFAGPYSQLSQRIDKARSISEVQSEIEASGLYKDLNRLLSDSEGDVATIKDAVRLRAAAEETAEDQSSKEDLAKKAAAIKRDPQFRTAEPAKVDNWIVGTLKNFQPQQQSIKPSGEGLTFGPELTAIVWCVLGALALAFLGIAGWFFWTRARTVRKTKSLLDGDEPLRSSDEWIAVGDAAVGSGDERNAVRAFYLAGLLRLDELGILRFERGQTNWQHLGRLRRAPMGSRFEFEPPTRRFDEIWFGDRPIAANEVGEFRRLASWIESVAKSS